MTDLKEIEDLVARGQYELAYPRLENFVQMHEADPRAWDLLAFYHGRKGDTAQAIAAVTKAIQLDPVEPAYRLFRARHDLLSGNAGEAAADAQYVVKWSEDQGNPYYINYARLLLAEALYQMRRYAEALAICEGIPPQTAWWSGDGMRTCESIISDCRRYEDH